MFFKVPGARLICINLNKFLVMQTTFVYMAYGYMDNPFNFNIVLSSRVRDAVTANRRSA